MNKILIYFIELLGSKLYSKYVFTLAKEGAEIAENTPLEGKFKKELVVEYLGDTAKRLTVLGLTSLIELAAVWINVKLGKSIFRKEEPKV